MKIINLFSGPGAGKSTTAAGLFYHMKCMGLETELVQEYAKDMVWEQRHNILEDQIYIFAKQQRRIARLKNHGLDWVITDSPIPLGLVYTRPEDLTAPFSQLVMQVFNSYENHNFLLTRNVQYNPNGRNQKTVHEAEQVDDKLQLMLTQNQITYTSIVGGTHAVPDILACVGVRS
jgi:hypothetical protein